FRASEGRARMVTLPGAMSSRWTGCSVDEQDVSLLGARLLVLGWPLVPDERTGLVRAMHDGYLDMRGDVGLSPTPVLDTLLGRQHANAFDALLIEPRNAIQAGVVFLHGYGGNFMLECWLVAQAARDIDAITICPSTGFAGRWSSGEGEHTL